MEFEVLNDRGQVLMTTSATVCIPNKTTIEFMIKAGYKFRIDGKLVSKKKIDAVRSVGNNDKI